MIRSRKTIILGSLVAGFLLLAGLQAADAGPRFKAPGGGDPGFGRCQDPSRSFSQIDVQKREDARKFMAETAVLRRDIAVKRAEKLALMKGENPDAERVAELTGQLFDLKEKLRIRARENGLDWNGARRAGFSRGCSPPGFRRPL